ncbi:MAG TPA: hypothetical protein DCZ92_02810 [Elusimicrobia bacterium]|nr:hypothetical protein [Elusimicrobiota bacterium]
MLCCSSGLGVARLTTVERAVSSSCPVIESAIAVPVPVPAPVPAPAPAPSPVPAPVPLPVPVPVPAPAGPADGGCVVDGSILA